MRVQHATVPLRSIGCGSTGRAVVELGLRELPGVLEVSVNPVTEMVYVAFDPAQCSEEEVAAVVRATGYGDTHAVRSPRRVSVGTTEDGRVPTGRFALAGGLWLAAGFTICAAGAALFAGVARGYQLWALMLPGIGTLRWATYGLGLLEAFALGFVSAWLFAWIYAAIPPSAAHPTRVALAGNQPVGARSSGQAL